MADERDLIRSRIDIVELVGQSVPLKRTGKAWKGLCPFHQDRNPSFTVSPDTGRYKCWSCGEAGDIFTWVMKTQNLDFTDALRVLAKQAGVELQARDPKAAESRKGHEAAMEEALRFFREQLSRAQSPQEYLRRRDLDDQVVSYWELGWAPDGGEALAIHLKRNGFSLADGKTLFLVDGDQNTGYRDKFRGRLIFPIRDERGHLVAFGGRIIGDGHPKYINSSDTPLYRKSRVLYGLYRAKETLNKTRRAVLVEGYVDVVACHRAGVTGAVASLGTSLSEEHAKLLKRWCDEVVILYDSDDAGRKAAERAVGILSAEELRVRVALMPQGDDPDTLLRKSGPAAVREAVEAGLTPVDYQMSALIQNGSPALPEFWDEAVGHLARGATELEVDKWVSRLSSLHPEIRDTVQAQKSLRTWIREIREQHHTPMGTARLPVAWENRPLQERMTSLEFLVFMAFCTEEFRRAGWMVARVADLFTTRAAMELSAAITTAFPVPPEGPIGGWLHQIEPDSQRQVLSDLAMDFRAENLTEQKVTDVIETLQRKKEERALRQLKSLDSESERLRRIQERLQQLKKDPRQKKSEDEDSLF